MMLVYACILKKKKEIPGAPANVFLVSWGNVEVLKKGLLIPVSLYKAASANCGFSRTRVLELRARSGYFQWLKSEEGV